MTTDPRPADVPTSEALPGGATRGGTQDPLGDDVLQFIGNATVLIRYANLTILTDPNFVPRGEEIPLGYGMTTRRLTDPAIGIADLPPVDLVVLSHLHADHFDRIAREALPRSMPIVTTPHAAEELAEDGFEALQPLETWEMHEHRVPGGRLRLTSMPGKHAPAALSVALPDVMGSYLELWDGAAAGREGTDPTLRVYISGDTIFYEGLREIPDRMPAIDLALLHLGGTRVMGVTVTMDADQGLELLETLRPALTVPIHFNDYEAFKSPLGDFVKAVDGAGLTDRVRYVRHGDVLALRGL
jgi:L-ascorbate metabolism protein UlaG (beta-lactamase superfamily)